MKEYRYSVNLIIFIIMYILVGCSSFDSNSKEKFVVYESGYSNIVDINGNYLIKNVYNYIDKFSEGYARVLKGNLWGFINDELNLCIETYYDYAYDFSKGYALVKTQSGWGFIDQLGNEVIKCKYDWASSFVNNLAAVCENNEFYYINRDGKKMFGKTYAYATQFSEGYAIVQSEKDSVEVIDDNGNVVLEFSEKDILQVGNVHEGAILINYLNSLDESKYKLIDMHGVVIADKLDGLTNFNNGIAFYATKYEEGLKWGIINKNGNIIFSPIFSNIISNIDGDLYGASIIDENGNEKWGFINKNGFFVLKPKFDLIGKYSEMVAKEANSILYWGVIDKNGEYIIDCKYNAAYSLY